MNETKMQKRGWVKNAAIIFLAVLLLLTFFSNTILNWSLPEVSGQYAGYGTITSTLRGSGNVEANMAFKVILEDETRTVKSVKVRQGDTVEVGQVLIELEDGDSSELEDARWALYEAEIQYQKDLLNAVSPDYTSQERNIEDLQKELNEAIAKRDRLAGYADQLAAAMSAQEEAQAAADAAQSVVDDAQEAFDAAKADYDDYAAFFAAMDQGTEDADDPAIAAAILARDAAKEANDVTAEALADAETLLTDVQTCVDNVIRLEKELSDLLVKQEELEEDYTYKPAQYDAYLEARRQWQNAQEKLNLPGLSDEEISALTAEASAAKAKMDSLVDMKYNSDESIKELAESLIVYKDEVFYKTRDLEDAKALLAIVNQEQHDVSDLKLAAAQAKFDNQKTTNTLTNAQRELDKAVAARKKVLQPEMDALKAAMDEAQDVLNDAKSVLTAAKKELTAAAEAAKKPSEYEEVEKLILAKQDAIREAKRALESTKVSDASRKLDLTKTLEQDVRLIADLKQKVERLEGKGGGNEILAKYPGTITAINVLAGDKVPAGNPYCEINVEDKGYTMSVSVTNEQSRMVNVGDKASVNNYWWGNIEATLTAIKTDRGAPGQKKLLEFTITGDVSDGQSLDLTIAQRQSSYNLVVPNSAVREDSDGTFILIAVAKSTPLGNRYIATRKDVTVIEKDNYNSALDGGSDFGYDYVITTSTKPLEAGMQVRLAEGK